MSEQKVETGDRRQKTGDMRQETGELQLTPDLYSKNGGWSASTATSTGPCSSAASSAVSLFLVTYAAEQMCEGYRWRDKECQWKEATSGAMVRHGVFLPCCRRAG